MADDVPGVLSKPNSQSQHYPPFAIFGKLLISIGVGVLLFVAWTLWGTGLYTAQQQDRLEREFSQRVEVAPEKRSLRPRPPVGFSPDPGEPVFRINVPAVGMTAIVVEGVGTEELRRGPGHYPSCRAGFERPFCTDFDAAWPGERGRVILSGHRTTYGAEFHRFDELSRGDAVEIETEWGHFVYRVTHIEVVEPDSRDIVVATDRRELVLTTCHPKFSAAQRLIVFAELANSSRTAAPSVESSPAGSQPRVPAPGFFT